MTSIAPMPVHTLETSDTDLVVRTLAGDRAAFEQIVARYQTLICSLGYSATGSIAQSEDLAQETFLAAWKQLPQLRDPSRLRSWLCGIARYTISNASRRNGREPSHDAEPLDTVTPASDAHAEPATRAISREEQAILWRALERIPELYREPLILFYRESQSIGAVAASLELSEDAVKQRLSRGRKLLQQEVAALVEGGLARTIPTRAFTVGVLAALPALLLPAQAAAAVGTLAAQGTAKSAFGASVGSALLGPLVAIFGTWVGYRMDLDSAGSPAEAELSKKFYRRLTLAFASLFVALTCLMFAAGPIRRLHEGLLVGAFVAVGSAYAIFISALMWWWGRTRAIYLAESHSAEPSVKPAYEFRSRLTFPGMPLVHVRIGGDLRANRTPVRAWIAIGDTAFGGLFAFGGLALAPLSVGGCAIGLLPFGGMAIGLLAVGGFSAGIWSFGGLAFGLHAFGGCAIALTAAAGGTAIARDFAVGGIASADQANTKLAAEFIQSHPFFRNANHVFRHHLAWLNLVWVIPMLIRWRLVRRQNRLKTKA